jgi:prolyl-tRNA synthetase
MDKEFRIAGVKNAAFPLLVTEKALLTEQSHIDGFAPEVPSPEFQSLSIG